MDYKKIAEIKSNFDNTFDKSILVEGLKTLSEEEKVVLIGSILNKNFIFDYDDDEMERKNEKFLEILRCKEFRKILKISLDIVKYGDGEFDESDNSKPIMSNSEYDKHILEVLKQNN